MNTVYIRLNDDLSIQYISRLKSTNTYKIVTDLNPATILSNIAKYQLSDDFSIDESTGTITGTFVLKPVIIEVYPTETTIGVGESLQLDIVIKNAIVNTVNYSIEDKTVFSVSKDDLGIYSAKGLKQGSTTIVFKPNADTSKSSTIKVNVI